MIPAFICSMDRSEAAVAMVDSNLHREKLLPSEKAFAYKMKMEALKHQGQRTDLTLGQVGTKLRSNEIIAQRSGESRNQVQRYIRLTNLIPSILQKVDSGEIALTPAVELSYLDNLGHATAAFTLDVYGHVTQKMKQESANRMEQFFKAVNA